LKHFQVQCELLDLNSLSSQYQAKFSKEIDMKISYFVISLLNTLEVSSSK